MINNYPRAFLWGALILALYVNFIYWQRDYGALTQSSGAASSTVTGGTHDLGSRIPQAATSEPAAPAGTASSATATSPTAVPAANGAAAASAGTVHVRTDVLDVDLSLQGGTFVRADLLAYHQVKGGSEPLRLFNTDPATFYKLQTGLGGGPAGAPRPDHLALFTSARSDFALAPGQDELRVPLQWTDGNGVSVTKEFVFHRGGYAIDLKQTVENRSAAPWEASAYAQLWRDDPPTKRSYFNVETYAFHGPAMYDGSKYRKLKVADSEDTHLAQKVRDGWIAALQHHFVAAIVPPKDTPFTFTMSVDGNQYALAVAGPARIVPPGGTETFSMELFAGPKLQAQLDKVSPELGRVTDYGTYLYPLARPLFIALQTADNVFGNWGVSIIFVTFLLKLLFYPLSEASGKSMAKMKALAPRVKQIQETYKDDREKSGRAMMELYQREKVNPVAGCLPMIVQLPVFIAFYWVLLESVEMRQAPFLGWINDLSSRDPWYVLPAIMAGAMFVQYKMNPPAPDPVQAKVFMIMPFAMSITFAFFPAGLVLYWITNTILTIAQQWNINRRIAAAAARKT